MARSSGKVTVDKSEVVKLQNTLQAVEKEMRTNRHLNAVTKAAFEILSEQFNATTHVIAGMSVGEYHHVYEWEHVGEPGFQLWNNRLTGRGGRRAVTWGWKASKTTVPTMTNVEGEPRFAQTPGFNPEKLQRIHVFVWKAPMMEYGVTVNNKPKLGHVLVFPNPNLVGGGRFGRGPRPVTFTPHPVRSVPGAEVQGNFTQWFVGWWGGGSAQGIVNNAFARERDNAFKRIFEARFTDMPITKNRTKRFSMQTDAAAAREGKNIARAIAGDMEHNYIAMAAKRKRKNRDD